MLTPAWHHDAISYCMEQLENTDQAVRKGACYMLGKMKAVESVPHLKYLAKVDFPEIQAAAYKALGQLGVYVCVGGCRCVCVGVGVWGGEYVWVWVCGGESMCGCGCGGKYVCVGVCGCESVYMYTCMHVCCVCT